MDFVLQRMLNTSGLFLLFGDWPATVCGRKHGLIGACKQLIVQVVRIGSKRGFAAHLREIVQSGGSPGPFREPLILAGYGREGNGAHSLLGGASPPHAPTPVVSRLPQVLLLWSPGHLSSCA